MGFILQAAGRTVSELSEGVGYMLARAKVKSTLVFWLLRPCPCSLFNAQYLQLDIRDYFIFASLCHLSARGYYHLLFCLWSAGGSKPVIPGIWTVKVSLGATTFGHYSVLAQMWRSIGFTGHFVMGSVNKRCRFHTNPYYHYCHGICSCNDVVCNYV